ncbi:MAG: GntR family transcriptional regulator [Lachnospiraceae bacterium]|nr:GntR family transcriptional regulator [Lachnospiraceae bacterium]
MQIKERFARETSREYAYRILKDNIIMLELEPGSLVSENALAAELGLSRTPVREALIELSKSKIVEIYPQKGSYISKIDYSMVEESRFLRLVLEKAVVDLACDGVEQKVMQNLKENVKLQEFYLNNATPGKLLELDNEFHKELFDLVNKPQTYRVMNSMMAHFDRLRSLAMKAVKEIKIVEDHEMMLEAIEKHDKVLAMQIVEKHLSRYQVEKQELIKQYPDYFA